MGVAYAADRHIMYVGLSNKHMAPPTSIFTPVSVHNLQVAQLVENQPKFSGNWSAVM